jgi:drug/metabolite transporter (DMT)-like permease
MLIRGTSSRASPAGLGAMIVVCTGWPLGSVLSEHPFRLAAGATGFASETLCGGGALMVAAAAAGKRLLSSVPAAAWLALAYLVDFGSLSAFNAYMVLLARVSAGLATSYTFVNPLIALLLGVALGGERVTPWDWLSASVVVAGVVLLLVGRR